MAQWRDPSAASGDRVNNLPLVLGTRYKQCPFDVQIRSRAHTRGDVGEDFAFLSTLLSNFARSSADARLSAASARETLSAALGRSVSATL